MGGSISKHPSLLKSSNLPPPQLLLLGSPNLICLPVGGDTHFSEAQTSVPNHRGLRVGKGRLAVQGSFAAVPLRALALGGGAPGFSLRLRGPRSMPPGQSQVGVRVSGAL